MHRGSGCDHYRWKEHRDLDRSLDRSGTWTVTALIVELNKEVVDELNVKKPILRTARVNIPTSYVQNIADVVQLNTDVASLGAAFATNQG